jgi:hypothetical protein
MGADLYLHSVLQECADRYGRASHLAQQAAQLVQGDVQQALHHESQQLKKALTLHAQQTGAMSPLLFDLVAEIADLAQDESTVWGITLADQIADLLRQADAKAAEALGESGPARLAHDLAELLKGRPEDAITAGIAFLAQRLATLAEQAPAEEATLTQALAQLGQSMQAVLQGDPGSALALLVEKQMLPEMEQACADQAECLSALTQALEPLVSEDRTDSTDALGAEDDASFAPAQVLARWHHLASRLHEATASARTNLRETQHLRAFQGLAVARHLAIAQARVQALWGEAEALQADLEAAMGTLGDLLVRTLPPLPGTLPDEIPNSADLDLLAQPISSPLREVIGTMLRQRIICHNTVHFIEYCVHVVERLLSGAREQALQAIGEGMITLLRAAQEERWGEDAAVPFSQQVVPGMAPSVPLAPGVTLLPGTRMDSYYLSIMASARQFQQQQQVEAWMQRALGEEQTTSAGGIVLSFWRLLQGEPLLWAALLTKLLGEHLASARTPASKRARLLVGQLQSVLQGEPDPRLQALLSELQAIIAPDSPLNPPTERLRDLLRGDTDLQVQETLAQLSQEVQHHVEQGDWPEAHARDLKWLLDLARAWAQASAGEEAHLLLTTLVQLVAACRDVEPEQAQLAELLTRSMSIVDEEDARLRILRQVFSALPELGPQPSQTDPRRDPLWRFRLLSALLNEMPCLEMAREEQAESQAARGEEQGEIALLEPVLDLITRMVFAWRFPPEGYFRDPYNDASTLWVAAGIFWPAIANHIAEPVDEQQKERCAWLLEAEDIPAQIPLAHVSKLAARVAARDLHLPSREQLARWGTHTIRVEEEGPYSLSAWHTYFAEQRLALLAFLEEALTRDEPILCSL